MFFYLKKSHSASLTYNVKKGIIYNYIPNMKALTQVLKEKKNKMKIPTCPKTLTTQNNVFDPQKMVTLSIFSIQCEERYYM